jgi:hypothetical protein
MEFFPGGRRLSRPSTDDMPALPVTNSEHYCAIYEFLQGSAPQTVYELGPDPLTDKDAFRLYVINTPTNLCLTKWESPPIVVRSFYLHVHYIAFFFQLWDVQARGFARPVVLIIANVRPELIDWAAFGERGALNRITSCLQEFSRHLFPIELRRYYRGIRAFSEKNAVVRSKFEELQRLIERFEVPLVIDESEPVEEHTLSYFTRINDNLRPMAQLLNLEGVQRELRSFVTNLPTDIVCSNVLASNWDIASAAILTAKRGREVFSLVGLLSRPRILPNSLFTLFSGQTIVIRSLDREAGLSFARRLSVLSPFDAPFAVGNIPEPRGTEFLRYSIVVSQQIQAKPLLDLDRSKFHGPKCPHDSALIRVFGRVVEESDARFMLAVSADAKRLFGLFRFKIAELCGRKAAGEDAMIRGLKAERFGAGDAPIFRYWMTCLKQQPVVKPVFLDDDVFLR